MDNLNVTFPVSLPILYHERITGMFVINGDGSRFVIYDADTKATMKLRPLEEKLLMLLPLGQPEHPYTTKKLITQLGMPANSRSERLVRNAQSQINLKRGIFIGGGRRDDGSQGIYLATTSQEALNAIEPYGKQAKTMMKRYETMKKRIRDGYTKQRGGDNE